MKIGFKITLFMVVLNVISVGVVGIVLLFQSYSTSGALAGNFTLSNARRLGSEFEAFLEEHWYKTDVLASVMSGFELIPPAGRRAFLNATLRNVLETSEDVANVWSIWDPNVLEGNDAAWIGAPGTDDEGRFVPGHVRNR
ncbi:MAG: hypothetical protein FWD88_02155, partial [Treponema sp.]|nr:hypothetical protein [Treponema sp.]